MKQEVPINKSTTLINTGCVVLASVTHEQFSNIITLAWQTPLSIRPRLAGISVGFGRYSHDMIQQAGEFVINIPGKNLLPQVHGCGTFSGKNGDKYNRFGLHPEPGHQVTSAGIRECLGRIECNLTDSVTTGDHTFFIGEVLYAAVEEEVYDFKKHCWKNIPESELLYHLGGRRYLAGSKQVEAS